MEAVIAWLVPILERGGLFAFAVVMGYLAYTLRAELRQSHKDREVQVEKLNEKIEGLYKERLTDAREERKLYIEMTREIAAKLEEAKQAIDASGAFDGDDLEVDGV